MDKTRRIRTLKRLKTFFSSSRRNSRVKRPWEGCDFSEGYEKPSVIHATIVIFLEFFAWGLLTSPTIQALKVAFPTGTFLKNGIVQGVKGILSFLSAPLLGALSDAWGRKSFLIVAVFFTCAPIPILLINATAYFVTVALSGFFSVTFSIVFAYVADCTAEEDRSSSYGMVSATFAASLVISPALGTYIIDLSSDHGHVQVVILATMITVFNLMFIVCMVPESLQQRKASWGVPITWEQADPFASLRRAGTDRRLLQLSIIVFLSYLPEAGQYSCFFLYLRQVVGFSLNQVAIFIAVVCVSTVITQTLVLSLMMSWFGYKHTIIIGLFMQVIQLTIYGIWSTKWLMWVAGMFASLASVVYPAISGLVSKHASPEQQGVALGILTGMRGLCNGLGPALFGLLFWLHNVSLSEGEGEGDHQNDILGRPPSSAAHTIKGHFSGKTMPGNMTAQPVYQDKLFIGVPFLFGIFPVLLAILVACCIKRDKGGAYSKRESSGRNDSSTINSSQSPCTELCCSISS